MHLITLSSNKESRCKDLKTGIGTSFLIEYDGHSIIFNTGSSTTLSDNLNTMNLDPNLIEATILSDNQYEIAEGYYHILNNHLHSDLLFIPYHFFEKHYTKSDFTYTNRTSSLTIQLIKNEKVSINYIEDWQKITSGLIIHSSSYRPVGSNLDMLILKNGTFQIDDNYRELYLVSNTKKGIVLIVGTAVTGLENIIKDVIRLYKKPIYGILGNFTIDQEKLKNTDIQQKLTTYGLKVIGCNLNDDQEKINVGDTIISNIAVGDEFFF